MYNTYCRCLCIYEKFKNAKIHRMQNICKNMQYKIFIVIFNSIINLYFHFLIFVHKNANLHENLRSSYHSRYLL